LVSFNLYDISHDYDALPLSNADQKIIYEHLKRKLVEFISDNISPSDIYEATGFKFKDILGLRPYTPLQALRMRLQNIVEVYWRCRSPIFRYFYNYLKASCHKLFLNCQLFLPYID
jgi:hypothetical protein